MRMFAFRPGEGAQQLWSLLARAPLPAHLVLEAGSVEGSLGKCCAGASEGDREKGGQALKGSLPVDPTLTANGWQGPLWQFQGGRVSSTGRTLPPMRTAAWADQKLPRAPCLTGWLWDDLPPAALSRHEDGGGAGFSPSPHLPVAQLCGCSP